MSKQETAAEESQPQKPECVSGLAKVQIIDAMTQYTNQRREYLAKLRLEPEVDKDWITAHEEVLDEVDKAMGKLLETPECPE